MPSRSILFQSLLTLAALLSTTRAFDDISTPETVTADQPFNVTLTTSEFDAGFDNFVVYLAITPPAWGTNPECTLIKRLPITSTNFALTIPPSVGPSGPYYTISIMERNSDPNKDGPSGFQYSNTFSLEGGTAQWSPYEQSGTGSGFADPDLTPCTAFNCARECSEKEKGDDAVEACVEKCPGVEKEGDEGDVGTGDGEGSASATTASLSGSVSASTSATATITSSGSSSATGSASGRTSTTASSSTSGSTTSSSTSSAASSSNSSGASSLQISSSWSVLVAVLASSFWWAF